MAEKKERYQNRIELLQGTLDLLVLQTLQWGPQHGYGISIAIRNQLNMATQALKERGVAQKEAERAAKREFGNVELTKEVTRDAWGGRWLAKLNQRRAVRLADVVEESRLHRDRRPHTGAGHWLQHRCFFVDRRLVAAEPRRSGSTGVGPNHLRSTWNPRATLQPDVRPPSRAAE